MYQNTSGKNCWWLSSLASPHVLSALCSAGFLPVLHMLCIISSSIRSISLDLAEPSLSLPLLTSFLIHFPTFSFLQGPNPSLLFTSCLTFPFPLLSVYGQICSFSFLIEQHSEQLHAGQTHTYIQPGAFMAIATGCQTWHQQKYHHVLLLFVPRRHHAASAISIQASCLIRSCRCPRWTLAFSWQPPDFSAASQKSLLVGISIILSIKMQTSKWLDLATVTVQCVNQDRHLCVWCAVTSWKHGEFHIHIKYISHNILNKIEHVVMHQMVFM